MTPRLMLDANLTPATVLSIRAYTVAIVTEMARVEFGIADRRDLSIRAYDIALGNARVMVAGGVERLTIPPRRPCALGIYGLGSLDPESGFTELRFLSRIGTLALLSMDMLHAGGPGRYGYLTEPLLYPADDPLTVEVRTGVPLPPSPDRIALFAAVAYPAVAVPAP